MWIVAESGELVNASCFHLIAINPYDKSKSQIMARTFIPGHGDLDVLLCSCADGAQAGQVLDVVVELLSHPATRVIDLRTLKQRQEASGDLQLVHEARRVARSFGGHACLAAQPECPRKDLCYGEICVAPEVCYNPEVRQDRDEWKKRLSVLEKE